MQVKYSNGLVCRQACWVAQTTVERNRTRVVLSLVDDEPQLWEVYPGGV